MRTTVILTGIIALASAAPATTTANSSVSKPSVVVPRVDTQDGNWHIGCGKDHKCSYYRGATATFQPRADHGESPIHPEYNNPAPFNPPEYTPPHPVYPPLPEQSHQSEAPHGDKPEGPHGGQPGAPHGGQPEGPYGGKPQGPHGSKPEAAHGGKPGKPSSPPFCNFVESECIDCNERSAECDTCNFMFKCGEKKQCNYYGFRETMTMCHERGEECSWPFFDENGDEYDVPENEHEHPYGGKPQQPHGNGGKPEQPHGGKPEHPYGKPEQPHNNGSKPNSPYGKPEQPLGGKPENPYGPVGPEHPQEEQPHGPKGGEQPYGPKGDEQPHGHNGTEYPHNPNGSPYGPNGQRITKDKTA